MTNSLKLLINTVKNVPKRIINAFKYSFDGLWSTYKKEESFRLEFLVFIILFLVLIFVPWPFWKKLTMLGSFFLIFFAEILNSAIEDICDLVSPDYNIHVKNAKDKGSLAVLVAIIVNAFVLLALIFF